MKYFKFRELLNYLKFCKNKYFELDKRFRTFKNIKSWFIFIWYWEYKDKVFPYTLVLKSELLHLKQENIKLQYRIDKQVILNRIKVYNAAPKGKFINLALEILNNG